MAKKSFTDSVPAELFIDSSKQPAEPVKPDSEPQTKKVAPAPEGYYIAPEYIEAKKRRVQLLLKPSLYEKGKAEADRREISFNELVNILLEEM